MDTETKAMFERVLTGMDAGFARVDGRFIVLQTEMRDGFQSVDERLTTLDSRVTALENRFGAVERQIGGLTATSSELTAAVSELSSRVAHLEKRVDVMSDDMQQRFRAVMERIADLERKNGWR